MPGRYSINRRSVGTILTGNIYNTDHLIHVSNNNPDGHASASPDVPAFKTRRDPATLPTTLTEEIQTLRRVLYDESVARNVNDSLTEWYMPPNEPRFVVGIRTTPTPYFSTSELTWPGWETVTNPEGWTINMVTGTVTMPSSGYYIVSVRCNIVDTTPANEANWYAILRHDPMVYPSETNTVLLAKSRAVPGGGTIYVSAQRLLYVDAAHLTYTPSIYSTSNGTLYDAVMRIDWLGK